MTRINHSSPSHFREMHRATNALLTALLREHAPIIQHLTKKGVPNHG